MKKRLNKKHIIIFIISAIILSSCTVLAYTLFAENIGFTPVDDTWDVENVSEALDDLNIRVTEYCNESNYSYNINPKTSSSAVAIHIDDSDNNFLYFYCGVDNYKYVAVDGICKVENLEPYNNYTITIAGIDKNMNVKKRKFRVYTPNNFIMDSAYLSSGSTQGSVSITSNNPDETAGLSITGTSDLRNYSGASNAEFIAHYRKWYKEIDLTNYNELTFYARKGANHGSIVIAIDDDQYINLHYGALDTSWHKYSVDLSKYIGNHVVTIAGGYTDYTGSGSSNTQYYHIELR